MERKELRQPNQIVKDNERIEATPILKQNYNYLLNLEDELYIEDNKYELDYPVCILSCHNRKPSVLDHLDQFTSPVYVFIYDFEKHLYDWLVEKPNLKKVIVPDEYLSCQRMRYYIQNYMGEQKHWQMDDDLKHFVFAIDKHIISIGLGLKIAERIIENELKDDFIITGFGCSQPAVKFWDGKFFHLGSPCCLVLVNGKKAIENNVHYSGDADVVEDAEMNINASKAGYLTKSIHFLYTEQYFTVGTKKSIASSQDKIIQLAANSYIKFGEYLYFKTPTHQYPFGFAPRLINKPNKKDPEFIELCLNKDYEGMRKYWKEQKYKLFKNAKK